MGGGHDPRGADDGAPAGVLPDAQDTPLEGNLIGIFVPLCVLPSGDSRVFIAEANGERRRSG